MSTPEFADSELDALAARLSLADDADPLVVEIVAGLQTTVEELRVAGEELTRQNDELLSLHAEVAAEAQRYARLFDEAPVAYLTTTLQGTITSANRAAADLLESDLRFIVGKPLPTFVDLGRRRVLRQELVRAAREKTSSFAIRMRRRNGVSFEGRARVVATRDELLWAILDETLVRQAEEQVWDLNRELEERVAAQRADLETLIDELPVGVAVVDRRGRVKRLNRDAAELLDRLPDDASGWDASLRSLDGSPIDPDQLPTARAIAGRTVRGERLQLIRRDGTPTEIEISAVPLRAGALIVIADVRARELRERSEREFVTNAAHQIRTPITAIAAAAAALRSGAQDDPELRERFLRHVELAIERLTNLSEALLTLARVQRGEAADRRIVPLRALIDRAVGRRPNVHVHCERGAAAVADEQLLLEALSNVVDNAERHAGEGPIDVTAVVDEAVARIEIRDRGPGIPADRRGDVLERFHGTGAGSGLGLAIAKEALVALDGSLTLSDAIGGGLVVTFVLPGARLL